MHELTVIGVEDDAVLAADDDGEHYRITIDDTVLTRIRQNRRTQTSVPAVAPREIQAHIRAGLSAQEVAEMTGATLEQVRRFEGPILAERDHIIGAALSVPVRSAHEIDPLEAAPAFGEVMRERLASLAAVGERWASWKETESGWILKLTFTADAVDHDARWGYDPRRHSLTPLNAEAATLSSDDELTQGLVPRLRAVTEVTPDQTRFDSGAFTPLDAPDHERDAPGPEPDAARRDDEADDPAESGHADTADLLEALRRRRGEREAARLPVEEDRDSPGDGALEGLGLDRDDDGSAESATPSAKSAPKQGRRGRAEMPSWDEIVFGARGDDDLA